MMVMSPISWVRISIRTDSEQITSTICLRPLPDVPRAHDGDLPTLARSSAWPFLVESKTGANREPGQARAFDARGFSGRSVEERLEADRALRMLSR